MRCERWRIVGSSASASGRVWNDSELRWMLGGSTDRSGGADTHHCADSPLRSRYAYGRCGYEGWLVVRGEAAW